MITTYRKISAAARAMQPLMAQGGFDGRTQLLLVRLWNDLAPHNKTLGDAELAALRAEGGVIEADGDTITFRDIDSRVRFLSRHEEMLDVEAEITPIHLRPSDALFAVSTPEMWAALDGFIIIDFEGSEQV